MAITLGTNIPSYNARMSLNGVTDDLTDTMKRLSSGLKINKAGDDAAGLVISENMKALIRGSQQAQTNIKTATSFLTIAEDGMISVGDHLQRINDLLVNMANDTNDTDSRTAAVNEIIERLEEINRLADSTNFNGRAMLDGTATEIIVQMGPDESDYSVLDISAAVTDCHTDALDVVLTDELNANKFNKITYKATGADDTADLEGDGTPSALYKDIYMGQTVYYATEPTKANPKPAYYIFEKGTADNETILKKFVYDDTTDPKNPQYKQDGADISVETDSLDFSDTDYKPNNVNCRKYMEQIQNAIAELATRRGLLGAYQNRMDSSYDSMTTRIESLEEAKGVYTDSDIAQEATKMTQQQILQQLNVSVLANANTTPQIALSLLGG